MRLCLVLILAFVYQVEPVPAQQSPDQSGSPASNEAAPAVKTPSRATEAAVTTDDQKTAPDKMKRSEWVQIFISGFAALVILWQAWIYNQQRKMMRRQIENAQISERAYIGVKGVITENQALGKLPTVRVTISNGGRTPAWKLKCPATLTLGTEFPHERPEISAGESPTFLAAGGETTFNYPFPFILTPRWLTHIQEKGWTAYLHMEAHFEDCWGEQQVMTLKLAYRPGDDRWGDYKERQEVIGTWHYT